MYSRNNLSFNDKFSSLTPSLERIGHKAVLDGEVVVVDESGKSRFQLLQNYIKTGQGVLAYYVFDIVHLDGYDLKPLPLLERKKLLRDILPELPDVRFSEHIEREGKAFFKTAAEQGLEGIIAKNGKSAYQAGRRSADWLKIKTSMRQEAVIGGFTEPRGGRKYFGALVLGVYEGGKLIYAGHTGGGFDQKGLADVRKRLTPLMRPDSPFAKKPKTNTPVHWVEPKIVCEVAFREWTGDGRMRQPVFLGIREDKPARDVFRENAPASLREFTAVAPGEKESEQMGIEGKIISISNPDKIYWPKNKIKKRDLADYYREVAPLILPHLKDRPESLHRHPDGITGEDFFQKNVDHKQPEWVTTVSLRSGSEEKEIRYLVCQNETTLLYMVNLGCIEINPWISRLKTLDNPDYCVLDLDPEHISFRAVIETARAVHEILESGGVEHYCKTSGATGLHIAIPLGAHYTYEQSRKFAEIVAFMASRKLPKITSLERSPKKRQKKVYIDFLQNRQGQTIAAPYCVRPLPGAPVSTPLEWKEVNEELDPKKFTIRTVPERFRKTGDLWKGVLGPGIDLQAALNRLSQTPG